MASVKAKEEIERLQNKIVKCEAGKTEWQDLVRSDEKGIAGLQRELQRFFITPRRRRELQEEVQDYENAIKSCKSRISSLDAAIKQHQATMAALQDTATPTIPNTTAAPTTTALPTTPPTTATPLTAGPDLLHEDTKLPGAILSQRPKKVAITSRAKEIDLKEEMGMAISIPRNAAVREEQIELTASFSGAYETPEDVTSVSPAYIIETSREVEFRKDVEVKLQHTASLQTAEDRQDVMVMKASNKTRRKFEEMVGAKLEFIPGYVKMKVKSIASSVFRICRRKAKEKYYSARLYKAFCGIRVTAVFCVCPEHPVYTKHCDKVVAHYYPDMADKSKATFFNAIIIKSDQVHLIKDEKSAWEVNMDRSMILASEVDSPERLKLAVSELEDYPPRIVLNLSPTGQSPAPVLLKVMGMKTECSFTIDNDQYLPNVDTAELVVATKEFESEVFADWCSPLVTCAREMMEIMAEVEPLLHDRASINTLVKKVGDIQQLIKAVITQAKGAKSVEASVVKVTVISHQFKKVAPAMRSSSAGHPDAWQGAVDVLTGNSVNLMSAIKELLKATEATSKVSASSKSVSPKYLNLIKGQNGEKFCLVNRVSSKWESFGILLEMWPDQLDSLKEECLGRPAKCWNQVMGQWLAGGGTPDYPTTWEGLYLLLEDVACGEVAQELKHMVGTMKK